MGQAKVRRRLLKPLKKPKLWLERKKKLQQGDGRPQAIAKWVHHALKVIHKSLKKAKLFEQRKAGRRLAQVREKISNGDAGARTKVEKFQQQVDATRAADLQTLAKQVLLGLKLQYGSAEQQEVPSSLQGVEALPAVSNGEVQTQVLVRISCSQCVRQQLQSLTQDFNHKFGASANEKLETTGEQPSDETTNIVLEKLKSSRKVKTLDGPNGGSSDEGGILVHTRPQVHGLTSALGTGAKDEHSDEGSGKDDGQADSDMDGGDISSSDLPSDGQHNLEDDDGHSFDSAQFDQPAGQHHDSGGDDSGSISGGHDSDVAFCDSQLEGLESGSTGNADSDVGSGHRDCWMPVPDLMGRGVKPAGIKGVTSHANGTGHGMAQIIKGPAKQARDAKKEKGNRMASKADKGRKMGAAGGKGKHTSKAAGAKGLKVVKGQGKRLGQRARRMMYEKMFGSNARHLQQQAKLSNGSRPGAHAKSEVGRPFGLGKGPNKPLNSRGSQSCKETKHGKTGEAQLQDPTCTAGNEVLHPSWQAKRMQKQKLVISTTPQANKVVFADDD